jgi:hypothetical protein
MSFDDSGFAVDAFSLKTIPLNSLGGPILPIEMPDKLIQRSSLFVVLCRSALIGTNRVVHVCEHAADSMVVPHDEDAECDTHCLCHPQLNTNFFLVKNKYKSDQ